MGRGIKSSHKSNVKSAIIKGKRVLDILCGNIELLDGEIYSYWKFEDQIILVENKAKSLRGHLVTFKKKSVYTKCGVLANYS